MPQASVFMEFARILLLEVPFLPICGVELGEKGTQIIQQKGKSNSRGKIP